ncbi:hypothetical protein BZA05DRAFT_6377 [Tricharina praecox]|uniref:uncharacterized protein n=1 Tax=Tricharina praecox TaxID=43433 RepID=UPI002220AFB9|nr:uncharacterized protein BZA05DRAFT_6377 [Tricharina praecox]KAI5858530.1 hypothetical protein BZA05DRAFT_6377 [Tricharina praecox]
MYLVFTVPVGWVGRSLCLEWVVRSCEVQSRHPAWPNCESSESHGCARAAPERALRWQPVLPPTKFQLQTLTLADAGFRHRRMRDLLQTPESRTLRPRPRKHVER